MEYNIEFEQEEDGRWIAEIPSLPGAMAYGSSREEASLRVRKIADEIWENTNPVSRQRMPAFGWMTVAITLATAILTYYPWFRLWMIIQPDCSPGQHDGQCGLASGINQLLAVPCAGLTGIFVAILVYDFLRHRANERENVQ